MTRPNTRFEIKYRLPHDKAERIREYMAAQGFMKPDENGEGGSPLYSVHSEYLDGPNWSIFKDTLEGSFERFKLRARCYAFTPDAPMFLECKYRFGEAMWKTRAEVPRAAANDLLWGGAPNLKPTPAIETFRLWQERRRAWPRVWVTYRRYAYVGGVRDLVRITFDTKIQCAPATRDSSEPPRWYPLPDFWHLEILELKYTGSYPGWLAELIRRFDLERNSMSKYKHSVIYLREHGIDRLEPPPPRLNAWA